LFIRLLREVTEIIVWEKVLRSLSSQFCDILMFRCGCLTLK